MRSSGLYAPDYKTLKSVGGLPYTNIFSITGVIETSSTDYILVSPIPEVQSLPHGQLTTPSNVKVASTSTDDNVTGTGARVVSISGLDTNFLQIEEIIILDGQTPVESSNIFAKVFEITILQYGSNVDSDTGDSLQEGDIYCGTGTFINGKPTNVITGILQSDNASNSRDAIFTVPDGKLLLLKSIFCGGQPSGMQPVAFETQVAVKIFGLGDNHWFKTIPFLFDGDFQYLPEFNLPIPPRSDIQIRVRTTSQITRRVSVETTVELRDLR